MKRAGSKSKLTQHIMPFLAAVAHECFVEPFCGTCSVLMAKPRVRVEVINDMDGELVNALRQIQHHPVELLRQLRFVPNSRDEFFARKSQPGLTEIQRAATYLYLNNISFSGIGETYGVVRQGGGGASTPASRIREQVEALNARIEGVNIERIDYLRCLELYDSPATLFFCDPPYTNCDAGSYVAWTAADVQQFRDALFALKGQWVVTLNDCEDVRTIFAGCRLTAFARARALNNKGGTEQPRYGEVIITPAGAPQIQASLELIDQPAA